MMRDEAVSERVATNSRNPFPSARSPSTNLEAFVRVTTAWDHVGQPAVIATVE